MLTFFSNGISNATLSGRSEGNVRLQSSKSSARSLSLFCCLASGGVDIAGVFTLFTLGLKRVGEKNELLGAL